MPRPSSTHFGVSRRKAISSSLAGLGLSLAPLTKLNADTSKPQRRIAVIGAGMGGIASSYFLGSEYSIDLFESREKVGGHADTIRIPNRSQEVSVDLGAQFIHPVTHPIYWSLLTELGLFNPKDENSDIVISADGTLSIFDGETGKSLFTSTAPLENLTYAFAFLGFSNAARKASKELPWETTLDEWLATLKIDTNFKEKVLRPWLASLESGKNDVSARYSARSTLTTFSGTFPENIFSPTKIYNSSIGLAGILDYLLARSKNVKVLLKSAVESVIKQEDGWYVSSKGETFGPYENVVVNAQPLAAKNFLAHYSPELSEILGRFTYYDTRIAIHRDANTVAKEKRYWSAQNAQIEGDVCEGSICLGKIDKAKDGLFKSWAKKRKNLPKDLIADREFKHSYVTPEYIQAVRDLNPWQGRDGLYFAGHFTTGADLQETALYSAIKVAEAMAPSSPELMSLHARLSKEGKATINYSI